MAASDVFDFDRGESTTVDYATTSRTVLADEIVRIRFTERVGNSNVWLEITRNAVASRVVVDTPDIWATSAVSAGDTVRLVASLNRNAVLGGIIEVLE